MSYWAERVPTRQLLVIFHGVVQCWEYPKRVPHLSTVYEWMRRKFGTVSQLFKGEGDRTGQLAQGIVYWPCRVSREVLS